ncbi:hypothetical protein RA307_09610 [Xanthobacteraceae bacterium Astr-EGSB]|uniref:hypothetical protein n=1 Tax=Astrobacterium formosum TaxID=3069710 RepID=UPI0027B69DE1|nr:hypothetical protein [Xanthobacteraceae bacterium Astr-EGSB]
MVSRSGFGRKGRSGDYDVRGSAAQKLAIESLRNIANVSVSDVGSAPAPTAMDDELATIAEVLRGAGTALAVAAVAERLGWDSDKTANALARGGQTGVLKFSREGDRTTVALAEG